MGCLFCLWWSAPCTDCLNGYWLFVLKSTVCDYLPWGYSVISGHMPSRAATTRSRLRKCGCVNWEPASATSTPHRDVRGGVLGAHNDSRQSL
jgi:hypothetical protein